MILCVCVCVCVCMLVTHRYLSLCDPMDLAHQAPLSLELFLTSLLRNVDHSGLRCSRCSPRFQRTQLQPSLPPPSDTFFLFHWVYYTILNIIPSHIQRFHSWFFPLTPSPSAILQEDIPLCPFRASAFALGNMNSFLQWELLLHLLLLCDIILGFIWGFLTFEGFGGHFPCSTQTLTTQQPMLSWRRMRKMDSRAMESPSLWEEALKLVSCASLEALGWLHSTNIPALNWNWTFQFSFPSMFCLSWIKTMSDGLLISLGEIF